MGLDEVAAPTPAFTADAPTPATALTPDTATEPAVAAIPTVVVATTAVVVTTAQPLRNKVAAKANRGKMKCFIIPL